MILNLIPAEILHTISSYAKILIPSFITYLVTRYTLNRPRKTEIREKQFDLVYLPLYRLTKQMLTPQKYKENIPSYLRKVDKLIYKNYQFVFPKTIKLFERLKEEMKKEKPNWYHLSNFEYQIDSDFEKLKRELGYPTNSFSDFFKRLNFMDKALYAITFIFIGTAIYCFAACINSFFDGDFLNSLSSLFLGCLIGFATYVILYPRRH